MGYPYDEMIPITKLESAKLGLEAYELSNLLRKKYGLPCRAKNPNNANFCPICKLKEIKLKIEKDNEAEKSHDKDWLNQPRP
jgi:ribosomal protein L40E